MTLSEDLGGFIARLDDNNVPARALHIAQTGFTDYFGVMVAGRDQDAVRILKEVTRPTGAESSITFSNERASAPDAAIINGAAAHSMDYDDQALNGHPSTVFASAILPEGEHLNATGSRLLVAYVAAYEVWAELIHREKEFHQSKGWHPTGLFGAIGAAAACASLRRLSPSKTANALGIAASLGGGLSANFGTMTKPLHAGRAAQSGILAARLAERGFTSAPDVLDDPNGFLCAISPHGQVDLTAPPALGSLWRILDGGLNVKNYPNCYCTHRTIDGMLELTDNANLSASDIEDVTVDLSTTFATILRNHAPKTALEARFSIEFAVASSILRQQVGLEEFHDDFVQSEPVQSLMRKVHVRTNDDYDPSDLGASRWDGAEVTLSDGRTLTTRRVERTKGHATNPLSSDELFEKFRACFASVGLDDRAEELFARFGRMPEYSARELVAS